MHEREEKLAPRATNTAETFESVMETYLSRRAMLTGTAAVAAAASILPVGQAEAQSAAGLTYTDIAETNADDITVPSGYTAHAVIKWGDPLFPGMSSFNVSSQTAAEQAKRFGFNNDMIALFPVPYGAPKRLAGRFPWPAYIMCVNHEYTSGATMFPDYPDVLNLQPSVAVSAPTKTHVDVELEAHGVSVVLIRFVNGKWTYDVNSSYNRRITATTPITISGPAAGDTLLQTPADPTGKTVLGTLNNCAGGFTPWGTYLTAEENFDQYFVNIDTISDASIKAMHTVNGPFSVPNSRYNPSTTKSSSAAFDRYWWLYYNRFDLAKAEGVNEMFRFGWIVEIDPYDPTSTPKKRTALGRFKHECATTVISTAGKVVAYSGDDERFDYVYKFVTSGTYNANSRTANMDLLDSGTLYVAKFNSDGSGTWMPITYEALNAVSPGKFRNTADVLIRTREAADILGATPMDRPEDVEAPHTGDFKGDGRVFIALTNNSNRRSGTSASATGAPRSRSNNIDAANPRANNRAGHVIQMTETNNDHASTTFKWTIFLLAGDPAVSATNNTTNPHLDVSNNGVPTMKGARFGCPDNLTFDGLGNLFISTDGNENVFSNMNDCVMTVSTTGSYPREVKRFLTGPKKAEICGPLLAPDNSTFFCAMQHPGEGGLATGSVVTSGAGRYSSWPDGGTNTPRPAVVAVRRTDGGRIGS